jgi:hypothetical protein
VRTLALVATAALLAVSGCSDDDTGPDEADRDVATARAGLAELFAGDHPGPRDQANGECFAREMTGRISLDAMQAAGLLDESYAVVEDPPSLRQDVAEAWAEAQFACTDFVEESTRAQQAATKGRIEDAPYGDCLRDALSVAEMKAAVVDSLVGDWQGVDLLRLGRAQSDCARESLASR